MTIAAHSSSETISLERWYPPHDTRTGPLYHLFEKARAHLKRTDAWKCRVCGATEGELGAPLEAHHHFVEFALQNGVDVHEFEVRHPEFAGLLDGSEEAFQRFVESEHNIMPLCHKHHTGIEGVHVLPAAVWGMLPYWRGGIPAPAERKE